MKNIYEGCLSVPNLRGEVARAMRIRIEALDRHGEALDFEIAGLTAGTFQHEFDHLEGTLFIDRVTDPKPCVPGRILRPTLKTVSWNMQRTSSSGMAHRS